MFRTQCHMWDCGESWWSLAQVGGFKVALIIYPGPTFIEHCHAPAVGLTRTPPSETTARQTRAVKTV